MLPRPKNFWLCSPKPEPMIKSIPRQRTVYKIPCIGIRCAEAEVSNGQHQFLETFRLTHRVHHHRTKPRSVQKANSYQYQRIDPLGFAFDNYDAVGQWPTEERVTAGKGANPPVNANGKLADGRAYDGPDTFKQLLVQDLDRFAEAFVEQLATFALRRAMTLDDASALKNIALTARKDNYKLLPILEALVSSELFQKR